MIVRFDYQGRSVSGKAVKYYADETMLVELFPEYFEEFAEHFVFVPNSDIYNFTIVPEQPQAGQKRKLEDPDSENGFKRRKIDNDGK